jgi:DNA-binding XRE family transcriptional regulator
MNGHLNGNYRQVPIASYKIMVPQPARFEENMQALHRDVNARFGLRLRELRCTQNMTQLRMAVDFGIDRSFISDVERGRKSISLPTLEILALGLNLSLSDLFKGV